MIASVVDLKLGDTNFAVYNVSVTAESILSFVSVLLGTKRLILEYFYQMYRCRSRYR
jgi:hypothetical protein